MEKIRLFRYNGAKTQYIDTINYVLNKWKAPVYAEGFLGSGVVYLNLNNPYFKRYYINDIDRNIIHMFKVFSKISYSYYKKHFDYVMKRFGDIETSKESFMNFREWFNKKVWRSDTPAEAIFTMILASSCINSFFKFSKNGFASSWGNRNLAKNYSEYSHHFLKKRLNNNTVITNLNFFEYTEFLKDEVKDEEVTMFLDPPYIRGGNVDYLKTFKQDDYNNFMTYIKNSKYNVAYTDVWSKDLDWEYVTLRETMVNTGPSTDKFENKNKEVIFYNK